MKQPRQSIAVMIIALDDTFGKASRWMRCKFGSVDAEHDSPSLSGYINPDSALHELSNMPSFTEVVNTTYSSTLDDGTRVYTGSLHPLYTVAAFVCSLTTLRCRIYTLT